jgi:amidase
VCLQRIAELNPALGAVITVSPDAGDQAAARDQEQRDNQGPLHGVPVLIKDNIDVRGMPATAGSLALSDTGDRGDAFLVTRLREAGAVILGKANLSEWANFRSYRSSSGWSTLGGQAANPHALNRSPPGPAPARAWPWRPGWPPGSRHPDRRSMLDYNGDVRMTLSHS